ncbi:MAG: response regulator [Candidatus Nitrosothermus koennekii]|nr:MAG: response regulator [Candidatus Nitrosothermus koennekii]
MKILAIDDNQDITDMLETVLSIEHDVTTVNNGRDGLKMIKEDHYDLVLLDLAMPEFTGYDVIKALKEEGLLDKQKIALFTASSMTDSEIDELLKDGITYCIRKPVDLDVLLTIVNALNPQA